MKINKIIMILILFFVHLYCFAQKGSFIGVNMNGWASRYFGDIYYNNHFDSNFGCTFSFGFGQLGERVYDNKTKDILGRTFDNEEKGKHFYKTSNIGGNFKSGLTYQFNFHRIIKLEIGAYIIFAVYQQKSSYDNYDTIVMNTHYQDIVHARFTRLNFAFGFEINMLLRISKRINFLFGISNPFYLFNPNHFSISKSFDPPLLGAEPLLSLGFRYQIGGILNR